MWPSNNNPSYGVFVERIHESIEGEKSVLVLTKKRFFLEKVVGYAAFYLRQARAYYQSTEHDTFIVHFISVTGIGLLVTRLLVGKRGSIIGFCHGSDVIPQQNVAKRSLSVMLSHVFLDICDGCFVPSHYLKVLLEKKFRFAKKIMISPSGGIASYLFDDSPFASRQFLFGYVGRLSEDKGTYVFLDAMVTLKGMLPRASILLIGAPEDAVIFQEYKAKLEDKVVFIEEMEHERLRRHFREIKFFVYPTRRDSLGLVGLEAMASGCLVISNCSLGPGSYISDKETGFCLNGGGVEELIELIEYAISMPQYKLNSMSQNAYNRAREYSEETVGLAFNKQLKDHVW